MIFKPVLTGEGLVFKQFTTRAEAEEWEAALKRKTLHEFETLLNTDNYRSHHAPWIASVDFVPTANPEQSSTSRTQNQMTESVKALRLEQTSAYDDLVRIEGIIRRHDRDQPNHYLQTNHEMNEMRAYLQHLLVAAFMFENGALSLDGLFTRAMETKSYPHFDFCLCYGLDINGDDIVSQSKPLSMVLDDERLTLWFLDHGADPNADKKGETALSVSMWRTPLKTIELLFERGGPDSIRKGSLLWYAVNRRLPDYMEMLNYLLFTKGAIADLNAVMWHDRPDLAREADWFIGRGTPLHEAAGAGRLDVVKFLVSLGADPRIPTTPSTCFDPKPRLPIDEARSEMLKKNRVGDFEGVIHFLEPLSKPVVDQLDSSFVRLERL
ncbi:MAG: hypothetical protein Q9200_006486 [Gallowayella weberi]